MIGTRELLGLLAEANPCTEVLEERLRRALRRGLIDPPSTVAGRFVWREEDVEAVAEALGLTAPSPVDREEAAPAS